MTLEHPLIPFALSAYPPVAPVDHAVRPLHAQDDDEDEDEDDLFDEEEELGESDKDSDKDDEDEDSENDEDDDEEEEDDEETWQVVRGNAGGSSGGRLDFRYRTSYTGPVLSSVSEWYRASTVLSPAECAGRMSPRCAVGHRVRGGPILRRDPAERG